MWSMWAWEIQRKSCCIAWWGQRPISKAILREGKIMQVSWPAIDKPFTGYPCIFITQLVLFELSLSLACPESLVPVSMASTNLLTVLVHKARRWSGLQSRGGGLGSWGLRFVEPIVLLFLSQPNLNQQLTSLDKPTIPPASSHGRPSVTTNPSSFSLI